MKKQGSIYGLPLCIRYLGGCIFLILAIYAVWTAGFSSIPRILCCITLIAISVCFAMKALTELLAFLFSVAARNLGKELGRLFAIVRRTARD